MKRYFKAVSAIFLGILSVGFIGAFLILAPSVVITYLLLGTTESDTALVVIQLLSYLVFLPLGMPVFIAALECCAGPLVDWVEE